MAAGRGKKVSQAELEIGRTVIRTVRFEFTQHALEMIVADHVRRAHRAQLKDFVLKAEFGCDAQGAQTVDDYRCVVTGEARTDGLAPTRKRKARA